MARLPTVGLLGITSPQADDELTHHHEVFLAQVGRRLATVADIVSGLPSASADGLAGALGELEHVGADAAALVLLGAVAPDGCADALAGCDLPVLLANVQPERAVGTDWTGYDLSFNAGIAAAQALAAELVTAGVRFSALTGDWLSDRFMTSFADWARAAQTLGLLDGTSDEGLLQHAAATLLDTAGSCRMDAMDWNHDALLLSPSPGFTAPPGPLTTAALARLEAGELRLVVGSGELLEAAAQPGDERAHLLFAPDVGLEAFMDAWLELGSPAAFVITPGDRHERWRRLAEMLEIEYEEI